MRDYVEFYDSRGSFLLMRREVLMFQTGDRVRKIGGDYRFEGVVVSVFAKLSGVRRCVVEDDRGVLFIFNETQLERI
jgi:hypothetical protein